MYVTVCGKFVPNEVSVTDMLAGFNTNITQSVACTWQE